MAQRIESAKRSSGGLEDLLDFAAILMLLMGVLLAVVVLVWQRISGVLPAIGILINSSLAWLLIRSLAEIIRLQKKLVGLPFEGKISGESQVSIYKCSDCGALLHSETRCDSCGAAIEET